jgi:hypothetical protein
MTKRPFRPVVLSGLLALMSFFASRPAAATDRKAEARTHFDQGVQLFRDSDFQAAAIEFRRAYDAEPNFRVLYNIGQACAEAKDYACALSSFNAYLEQGGTEVPAVRRTQLEQQMEKLRIRTGRLSVRTNLDGAAVMVDDTAVGRTPLPGPLLVSAGRRKVVVVSPSGVQQLRTVEVAGGDDVTVELPFQATGENAVVGTHVPAPFDLTKDAPLEPESETAARESSRMTRIVVPAVVTGVLAACAGVSGYLALRSKHEFDDAIANRPGDRDTIENSRMRTRAWALSTDLLTGAAIVGGVFTVIAILRGNSDEETTVNAATSVSIGPRGIGLSGRF